MYIPAVATDDIEGILVKAKQVFGRPLNFYDHYFCVFQLNDAYEVSLTFQNNGLSEVDVRRKSDGPALYASKNKPWHADYLSEAEYKDVLQKISELKQIGNLVQQHGPAQLAQKSELGIGLFNTDSFERAFVDRIVPEQQSGSATDENVLRFDVYFIEDIYDSPEQIVNQSGQAMLCINYRWYYLTQDEAKRIQLGIWQKLQIAGPNYYFGTCIRTTPVYDADGFTVEQPANERIVLPAPYRMRSLAGVVRYGDSPVPDANVEIKRVGDIQVLRTKTDAAGRFKFHSLPSGTYKLNASKDDFKSLSGKIIISKWARKKYISLEMELGT